VVWVTNTLKKHAAAAPVFRWVLPRLYIHWEGLSTARHGEITAKSLPPPVSRRRVLSGLLIGRERTGTNWQAVSKYTSGAVLAVMETDVWQ
jgi:hypothetical protein